MRGKSSLRKFMFISLTMALFMSLLAACSGGNGDSSAENRVLRIGVLYGGEDNEPYFRQQYTDIYEYNNPNLTIEIVSAINYDSMRYIQPGEEQKQPDPYEEMQKMLTGTNPVDVVVVEYNMLRRLVQDNLLKELDPLIQQDEFDISDYVPTVIDGIKSAGDNKIYALTPTFTSSALYYNKKIFQDAGLQPPTDNMQWEDVMNVARQLSKGEGNERTYGLMLNRWSGDGFYEIQNYAAPLQLKIFDDKGEKMLVNSDQWKKVWEQVAGLYKDKIIPTNQDMYSTMPVDGGERPFNPFEGDLFLNGRVAMMVGDYYYLNELRRADLQKDNIEGFQMVDWDVVTVPEHPEKPGVGGNIYLSSLMGINTNAQNQEDAWEFVKFMNSKEWAKLRSRSTYEMVARKEFIKPREGMDYNLAAFYSMQPVPPMSMDMEKIYRERPNIYQVNNIGQMLFQEVVDNKKTVAEALAEWETKGDAMLQEIKSNPNGPLESVEGQVGNKVYE
ncbi:ABC transporter substrate-binding protein [Paenibacillus abyssi]|uniref:ABC transporter substrate-binding protein n=1 Tax=Paenibacillus abyssi TaxID=1340531 RepID=A0A917D3S7_9BACL|nr:extracellular solute-binding protein [Paenibacillus abyssi]GGG09931.1 ABC transporter substrate-binding protein [Paenibacillus abyssi]